MSDLLDRIKEIYSRYGVNDLAPEFVMIVNDCRADEDRGESGDLSKHYGINLGKFYYPSFLKINLGEPDEIERLHDALCVHPDEYEEDSEFNVANPLILADTGEFIWGMGSYWGPIPEEIQHLARNLEETFNSNKALEKLESALQMEHSYESK